MDMNKIMQQAQQLQQRMGAVQNELAKQKTYFHRGWRDGYCRGEW